MEKSFSTPPRSTGVRDPVRLAFRQLCRTADTPLASSLLCEKNDLSLLKKMKIDPSDYRLADDFKVDYLLVSFLSKYKGLNTGIDTESAALSSFATAENHCRATNERLRRASPTLVDPILYRAQALVAKALGIFSLTALDGGERWGPGAAYDLRRSRAYLDTKFAELPISVTMEAAPLFKRSIQSDLHWSELILGVFPEGPYSLLDSVLQIVPGSKIVTVDKNAKTDRTIAIEPRGNMFLQKSVGRYIRNRLKRYGVDLDNQGLNQDLAREAFDQNLATIDLSMASDSISGQLILELLPFEWAYYLDQIRSRRYELDGDVKAFEKFSSMGNGFTFELESLIFWALTKASMVDETMPFAIYGDDIILPSSDAHVLIMALSYCGFSTNDDKSFIEGPFRESCGRHFFEGHDVTPIYQKEVVSDALSHRRLCNRLKRLAIRFNDGDKLNPWVNQVWRKVYQLLGDAWRPHIPCGTEGDDGYLVAHNDIERLPPYDKVYGYKWQVLVQRTQRIPAIERALLAYALRLNSGRAPLKNGRNAVNVFDVDGIATMGDLPSAEECAVTYARVTRRIEPSWEFSLEST